MITKIRGESSMVRFVTSIITVCLFLFSQPLLAGFGSKLCKSDFNYFCYKVKSRDSWQKLFPSEEQRDLIMRLNRMNTRLYSGLIIAIPKSNHPLTVMDIAPFNKQIEAPGEKVIFVSIKKLAWGAYEANGELINWGPVSTAKGYCPDIGRGCHTAMGEFAVYRKEGSGCSSSKYPVGRGGAPMPYCMFFHGGFALHGSYDVPGYNDSHGCIRMFVNDAKWLNQEFVGDDNVAVIIRQF
jgi:L,D-transpeptidase ErfK/SrfK